MWFSSDSNPSMTKDAEMTIYINISLIIVFIFSVMFNYQYNGPIMVAIVVLVSLFISFFPSMKSRKILPSVFADFFKYYSLFTGPSLLLNDIYNVEAVSIPMVEGVYIILIYLLVVILSFASYALAGGRKK